MLYGYARVSSDDQDTAIQRSALRRAGVRRVIEEKVSGASRRPALEALIERLGAGDTLVVYRVDRLSRSLGDLLRVWELLAAKGVAFRSLTEPFDTGSPTGKLVLHLLGALAEFERQLIRERCSAGMREYRARGERWGRPRRLDWEQIRGLAELGFNPCQIARRVGAHHSGVRYVLRAMNGEARHGNGRS